MIVYSIACILEGTFSKPAEILVADKLQTILVFEPIKSKIRLFYLWSTLLSVLLQIVTLENVPINKNVNQEIQTLAVMDKFMEAMHVYTAGRDFCEEVQRRWYRWDALHLQKGYSA